MDAMKIKEQSFINEKIVAERKLNEVEKKKQMVERSHNYQDYSR